MNRLVGCAFSIFIGPLIVLVNESYLMPSLANSNAGAFCGTVVNIFGVVLSASGLLGLVNLAYDETKKK